MEKGLDLENYSDQSLLLGLFPVCLVHQVCPVWKEGGKYSIQSWWGVCTYQIHVGLRVYSQCFEEHLMDGKFCLSNLLQQTGLTGGPLAPFSPGVPGAPGGPGGPGGPCAPGSPCWETLSYNLPCWCGRQHTGHARHTSSQHTAKKRRGGRSETRVNWAARQAVLIYEHGDSWCSSHSDEGLRVGVEPGWPSGTDEKPHQEVRGQLLRVTSHIRD